MVEFTASQSALRSFDLSGENRCKETEDIDHLRPNNDLSQTSHCDIKGLSVSEVLRIENMITQMKFYPLLPFTSVINVWKHKRRICNLILGLKGLIAVYLTEYSMNELKRFAKHCVTEPRSMFNSFYVFMYSTFQKFECNYLNALISKGVGCCNEEQLTFDCLVNCCPCLFYLSLWADPFV